LCSRRLGAGVDGDGGGRIFAAGGAGASGVGYIRVTGGGTGADGCVRMHEMPVQLRAGEVSSQVRTPKPDPFADPGCGAGGGDDGVTPAAVVVG
jgi:hypothetical protein